MSSVDNTVDITADSSEDELSHELSHEQDTIDVVFDEELLEMWYKNFGGDKTFECKL